MRFARKPKPPTLENTGPPYRCADGVTVTAGDSSYGPGDTVPEQVVQSAGWLIVAGRVVGQPKKPAKKPAKTTTKGGGG